MLPSNKRTLFSFFIYICFLTFDQSSSQIPILFPQITEKVKIRDGRNPITTSSSTKVDRHNRPHAPATHTTSSSSPPPSTPPSPTVASLWLSSLSSPSIVGLDVEWRPSYSRNHTNPAATLQLCSGPRCLIFQLIHSPEIPKPLADLKKLEEDYQFGFNTNAVDLRDVAAERCGDRELKWAGVKTLAKVLLGKEVEKPKRVTMSRWDNRWLSYAQVQYACVDAFVCFEIGRVLNADTYVPASSS